MTQDTLIQATDILYKYATDSDLRERVTALLKNNGDMAVGDLSKRVAIELFSAMPDVTEVAEHVALFMVDLPLTGLNYFAMHVGKQVREDEANRFNYLCEISAKTREYPACREKLREAVNARIEENGLKGQWTLQPKILSS